MALVRSKHTIKKKRAYKKNKAPIKKAGAKKHHKRKTNRILCLTNDRKIAL